MLFKIFFYNMALYVSYFWHSILLLVRVTLFKNWTLTGSTSVQVGH